MEDHPQLRNLEKFLDTRDVPGMPPGRSARSHSRQQLLDDMKTIRDQVPSAAQRCQHLAHVDAAQIHSIEDAISVVERAHSTRVSALLLLLA